MSALNGFVSPRATKDINRDHLLAGLDFISRYIADRHQSIELVVIGGAVNTLYLQSRPSPNDINVFGSELSDAAQFLLDDAMLEARTRIPSLGTGWLNTQMQTWMSGPTQDELTYLAQDQGVEVYRGSGLTLLAAPWEYAFTAKISMILTSRRHIRSSDLADAVEYLHEYVKMNGTRPVPVKTVQKWAQRWNLQITQEILRDEVAPEYLERYRRDGIVF